MTATVDTQQKAFSEIAREATRAEHEAAENETFIGQLMSGKRSEADYWRLLSQYLPIYAALDEAMDRATESGGSIVERFHDPRFSRTAAIRADFAASGAPIDPPLPVTERYARRILEAGPAALLAHHYLRYLGDLSGGQAIGALVARHYGVPKEQLAMWDFSDIESPKRIKDAYRIQLDSLTDPAQQEEFLAEARAGYLLAGELFSALA
ncbi:biliverdin-producing heme oxygenase [Dermabacteraceae bacterium TAE3-ERU27]|nr:biliverdin-producing heme oxygenase [Dermabacteraceae bacterium TAE3-ERU27]